MSEPAKKPIVKKIVRNKPVKNTTQNNAAQAAADGGNTPQDNSGELQLKLAAFRPVYYSKSENVGDSDTCSICKVKLTEVCNMCQIQNNKDCPTEGNSLCHHLFHRHCIESWFQSATNTKKACPLCSANWEPTSL